MPRKYNIMLIHFEEDNVRDLYIESLHLLTNLRS